MTYIETVAETCLRKIATSDESLSEKAHYVATVLEAVIRREVLDEVSRVLVRLGRDFEVIVRMEEGTEEAEAAAASLDFLAAIDERIQNLA